MKRAGLALAVLGGIALTAPPTQAEESASKLPAALSWRRLPGAESCATPLELARHVEAHLGRKGLASMAEAALFIDASIEPDTPQGFRVRIVVTGRSDESLGDRVLVEQVPDCREATDAAALAIALMIDPDAGAASTPSSAPTPEPPAPPFVVAPGAPVAPSTPCAPPSPPPGPPPSHWRARLAAGPVLAFGQLPRPAWGALATMRVSPLSGVAGLDWGGFYLAENDAEVRAGAGGQFTAAAVTLAGWWAPWRHGSGAVSVGAGAQAGGISASGFGFSARSNYAQSWLLNATVDVEASVAPLGPWGLLARASLAFPLWRDTFEATQAGEPQVIFQPSVAIVFVSLSLSFGP